MNMVAIPSRHLGGLTRLMRPRQVMPAAMRVMSVTKLMGNTDGNRKLNGGFLTGVHRASTVLRMLHYFSSSGMARMSKDMGPIHSGRVVSCRLRLGSLSAVSTHVRGMRGRTRAKNSGATGRACSVLIGCGRTLRRKGSTHAMGFRAGSRRGVTHRLFLLADGPMVCIYGISRTDTMGKGGCMSVIHRTMGSRSTRVLVITTGARSSVTRLRACRSHRVFLTRMKLRRSKMTQLVGSTCGLLGLRACFATNMRRMHT